MPMKPKEFAAAERWALIDLLLRLGPDAPTLCPGWTTADMAAHLVVRETRVRDAIGLQDPTYADRARRAMDQVLTTHGYAGVVEMLRTGPPSSRAFRNGAILRAMWISLPGAAVLDYQGGPVEFFVHHEDVRRAQPGVGPRPLATEIEDLLWSSLRRAHRFSFRRCKVGVRMVRTDTGAALKGSPGRPVAVLEGLPSELTLFAFGRKAAANVQLSGPPTATATLMSAQLGV